MALIYTINFDSRYAGYEATVTDSNGSEVAGSPVTLDSNGDATITLTTLGHYRAAVFNEQGPFGDGYSVVDCVLDEAASIAAGGGGAVIDAASVLFEINNGVTIAPDGSQGNLTWDTVPEGYTGSASALALDTGVYHASLDLEFSTPAEDRLISVFFNSENSIVSGVGPLTIASVGNNAGRLVQANGLAIIRAGGSISVSTATSSQGASSPADLAVGYAALTLTPFIPA